MEIYLSLGSNLGNRKANILSATEHLEDFFQMHCSAKSPIMEFPSWGFEAPDFLNGVVRFDLPDCGFSPDLYGHALLREIKKIETEAGRVEEVLFSADGKRIYHNRTIDIDILYMGKEVIESEDLTVPHPLISQRDFVKLPLASVVKAKAND